MNGHRLHLPTVLQLFGYPHLLGEDALASRLLAAANDARVYLFIINLIR